MVDRLPPGYGSTRKPSASACHAAENHSVGRDVVRRLGLLALLYPFNTDASGPINFALMRYDTRMKAADAFAPSMRGRIDLERLYRQAKRLLPKPIDGQPPLPLPGQCPVTLDELLSEGEP